MNSYVINLQENDSRSLSIIGGKSVNPWKLSKASGTQVSEVFSLLPCLDDIIFVYSKYVEKIISSRSTE